MRTRALLGLGSAALAAALGCSRFEIAGAGGGAPGCADGALGGQETDVDCGGPVCGRCAPGKACAVKSDCEGSAACQGGVCVVASCLDGTRDGTETDVDCGGGLCPRCAGGKACASPEHCTSGVCAGGLCAAPACSDGVKNGAEVDVDCGGGGCPGCGFGKSCTASSGCAAGTCAGGRCAPLPTGVWEKINAQTPPPARRDAQMAWDASTQKSVVHGGADPVTMLPLGDSYAYDGAAWTFTGLSPLGVRRGGSMVAEASTGAILVFGGSSGVPLADTWEWNGAAWLQRSPALSPAAGSFGDLAYDTGRARAVLLSGTGADGTWEWNGAGWALAAAPAAGPSQRLGMSLAYDRRRAVTILFGGTADLAAGTGLADTWSWNGAAWKQLSPPASPPARFSHSMAADADRGVLVLVGGLPAAGAAPSNDTWEWDGTTWTRTADGSAGPSGGPADHLVYDAARRKMVLLAHEPGQLLGVTWEYHPLAVPCAADADCGSGHCADGLCCASACGVCQACDLSTSPGACAAVVDGPDPDTCAGDKTCDAAGKCVAK